MPPKGFTAWLTADDALSLLSTGTPSKLGQELSRGVDPNQALEIPILDRYNRPHGAIQKKWPTVPPSERKSCSELRDLLLPPPGPLRAAAAAELDLKWAWDPSWDDCIPLPPPGHAGGGGGGGTASPAAATVAGRSSLDARWPLLLVACLVGHSPLVLDRLLKAGADPNATHPRSGSTALMCLAANEEMGSAAKKEGIQMLAKYGFKRWGAVRRDAFLDAVLIVLMQIGNEQHHARRAMASRPPAEAAVGPKAGGGLQMSGRKTAAARGGGGGGGGGGAAASANKEVVAMLERCQRRVQEGLDVLEELLRYVFIYGSTAWSCCRTPWAVAAAGRLRAAAPPTCPDC
ncbi:hypothetical protein PLESTF_001741100 [Pleodorina starrii]|nr:hypothetical protein PLESTF_001741100 [Pleodorina starrii]